jgi:hypothetical protein
LTSVPPGARVYVDGTARGATPLQLELPRGQHKLVLMQEGYRLFHGLLDGQDHVDVRLEPAELPDTLAGEAGLKVACKGERRVFVDGVDTGRGCPVEARISVTPGPHQLGLFEPAGDRTIEIARPVNVRDRGASTRIILDE